MRVAVVSVVLAACARPPTVALELAVQPTAIAFRGAGEAAWRGVAERAHSERSAIYDIPDEDGTLAIACTWPDGTVQVEELLATAGDFGSAFYAQLEPWPRLACGPAAPPTALVAGNMIQGGEVYIGSAEFEGYGQWGFAGPVTAGVHDLVAISGSTVLVRHDQAMLSSYDEPLIDITQGIGLDVEYLYGSDDVLAGEMTTTLVTVNGTRLDVNSPYLGEAYVVPSTELEPGDTQIVTATFGAEEALFVPPVPTEGLDGLVPPAVASAIQLDPTKLTADLSPIALDGAVGAVRVAYYNLDTPDLGLVLAATATASWLARYSPRLAIDTSFPGYHWAIGANPSFEVIALGRAPAALLATYLAVTL